MRRENRANERRRSVKQAGRLTAVSFSVPRRYLRKTAVERPWPPAGGNQSMPSSGMSQKYPAKHAVASRCCE
jgi:hypothetical protein